MASDMIFEWFKTVLDGLLMTSEIGRFGLGFLIYCRVAAIIEA